MTIEEVKKHFESQGIKEGDELICALTECDSCVDWRYKDMEEREAGDVLINCIRVFSECDKRHPFFNGFYLYDIDKNKFATPVKNEE